MMEKGSVKPPLDHLENYQEIPEKWLNFGSPFAVKKLEVFQLQKFFSFFSWASPP